MAWGQKMAVVAEKRGWGGPANSPEWALAISSIGFIVPTVMCARARYKALKAREAEEARDLADRRGEQVSPLAGVQSGAPDGS